jgi:prepilin-type N-terminal cleavage/methylation domain-containing protein
VGPVGKRSASGSRQHLPHNESEIIVQTIKQKWAARHEDDGGFTLIELLVVIVIIGILSAVVVFSVTGISDKGTESACKADYRTINVAEEAYYADEDRGSYGTEAQLVAEGYLQADSDNWNVTLDDDGEPVITAVTKANGGKCEGVSV